MFEDYLQDSYNFFEQANQANFNNDEREAKRLYRASVFCAASSIESFINFIGDTFSKGGSLDKIEVSFLNDKILEVNPSRGTIEERVKYNSIDSKVKFIIKRFNVQIDPGTAKQWRDFIEFKELRDKLIHPRHINDEISLNEYKIKIQNGLNSHIDIMNLISKKLFSKPLRKSLTELKI